MSLINEQAKPKIKTKNKVDTKHYRLKSSFWWEELVYHFSKLVYRCVMCGDGHKEVDGDEAWRELKGRGEREGRNMSLSRAHPHPPFHMTKRPCSPWSTEGMCPLVPFFPLFSLCTHKLHLCILDCSSKMDGWVGWMRGWDGEREWRMVRVHRCLFASRHFFFVCCFGTRTLVQVKSPLLLSFVIGLCCIQRPFFLPTRLFVPPWPIVCRWSMVNGLRPIGKWKGVKIKIIASLVDGPGIAWTLSNGPFTSFSAP